MQPTNTLSSAQSKTSGGASAGNYAAMKQKLVDAFDIATVENCRPMIEAICGLESFVICGHQSRVQCDGINVDSFGNYIAVVADFRGKPLMRIAEGNVSEIQRNAGFSDLLDFAYERHEADLQNRKMAS